MNKEELPSTKEYYVGLIKTDPFLTSAQKDKVLHVIAGIPETDTALRSLLVQRVIGRLIPERQPLVECLFA